MQVEAARLGIEAVDRIEQRLGRPQAARLDAAAHVGLVDPHLLQLVEVAGAYEQGRLLRHWPRAGDARDHLLPGAAGQHRQAHAVEVALDRGLGGVEVRVGVEVEDARRGLVEAGHAPDRREAAAAREDDREGAVVSRGADALGDHAHQLEARVVLARAAAFVEVPVELQQLEADLGSRRAQRILRTRFQQPLRPAPDSLPQPAQLVGDDQQAEGGHQPVASWLRPPR